MRQFKILIHFFVSEFIKMIHDTVQMHKNKIHEHKFKNWRKNKEKQQNKFRERKLAIAHFALCEKNAV